MFDYKLAYIFLASWMQNYKQSFQDFFKIPQRYISGILQIRY